MIKALIIDDDPNAISVLQRMLLKKFNIESSTASNGMEGLSLISKNKPNLVFCDIYMPLMTGVEVLEAIRSDPEYDKLKIVMISSVNEIETINKVISLGVSDYILKPLFADKVYERLKKIISIYMATVKANVSSHDSNSSTKGNKTLLLADKDINFRYFFKQLFESQFKIIEATNGVECLQFYFEDFPQIIMIGEELGVINEFLVAKKIRTTEVHFVPQIFLLNDSRIVHEKYISLFDGIIKKSFVPESFQSSFMNIIQHKNTFNNKISETIKDQMHSAIRRTIGDLLHEETFFVKSVEKIKSDNLLCCNITFLEESMNVRIIFELITSSETLSHINEKLTGKTTTENEISETLKNISNTIIERLKLSLEQEKIKLTQSLPEITTHDAKYLLHERDIQVSFKTEGQSEFLVAVIFEDIKK